MTTGEMPAIDVIDLFPRAREGGIRLLASLSEPEWRLPTACPGWSVHDIALHIAGGLLANVSRRRDGHPGNLEDFAPEGSDLGDPDGFIRALNAWNEGWVMAARRISPPLLIEIIDSAGSQLEAYFRSLDPEEVGHPVGWVGPDPAPVWLDIAREYTELWTHLAQIREAAGRGLVDSPHLLAPVLATYAFGIPRALRAIDRPEGTTLRVIIRGEAGAEWWVVGTGSGWQLHREMMVSPDASVEIDQVVAWRQATKGMSAGDTRRHITIDGDSELGEGILNLVAVLV